jgi:hypothetical protein
MNYKSKFEQYLAEEDSCVTVSGDVATVNSVVGDKKKIKKVEDKVSEAVDEDEFEEEECEEEEEFEEDEDEEFEEDEDEEDYDIDGDGQITADDVYEMVKHLSKGALMEVIDLVASYLENRFEEPDDVIPADGRARVYEGVIKKVSIDKISKKSGRPGYKLVDGKEIKMSKKDIKDRVKSAIKASQRRKSRPRKAKECMNID